ncbi:uncharacterized protein [Parasteatoda tepidariorum]|uniref:uncharacterized protein n=1 Tax=Parasteatoda tepidariorum TaxID=114398 RepID=UPI00077F99DD|nr:uncharacterized protein LOC107438566 [Parasteatoda tepidariorum]
MACWQLFIALLLNLGLTLSLSPITYISEAETVFGKAIEQLSYQVPFPFRCDCKGMGCDCNGNLTIPFVGWSENIHLNLTYFGSNTELLLFVEIAGIKLFNNSISLRNPPQICLSSPVPPGFGLLFDFCIGLFDIQSHLESIHACLKVSPRILKFHVFHLNIGCINIQPQLDVGFGDTKYPTD